MLYPLSYEDARHEGFEPPTSRFVAGRSIR